MAEPKIVQSKQNRTAKKVVNIDGHTWEYVEPGMGTQSRLSQSLARTKLYGKRAANLEKKLDDDTITDEELEQYEDYLDKVDKHTQSIIDIFATVYIDGSKDNNEVRQWLDSTPPWKLEQAFNDISKQDNKTNDGANEAFQNSQS